MGGIEHGKRNPSNDGSEHAFSALSLALKIAKPSGAELHMVSVEEINYLPDIIEEVSEEIGAAARRFHQHAKKQ